MTQNECVEPYRECVRSRQERVRQVIEDNPEAPARRIAEIAGVTPTAVNKYKKKMENAFSTTEPVKLSDLYDRNDVAFSFDHPNVRAIENAINRCSRAELAFVICKMIPHYKDELIRRVQNERNKCQQRQPATQENTPRNDT